MLKIWNYNIGMMVVECEKIVFLWLQSVYKKKTPPRTHPIISSFGWFVDLLLFYATATVFQSYNDDQLT